MFCYEEKFYGKVVMKGLIPNGKNIEVDEENKKEYIKKLCYEKMGKGIKT